MNLPRISVLAAAGLLAAAAAVALWAPESRFAILILAGRNDCPLPSVWTAADQQAAHARLVRRLDEEARLLRSDRGFALWEIGGERYWMPAGSRMLPAMVADQRTAVYDSAGHGVRPGDVVLDCGANVGLFTMEAVRRGAALVVAIEPASDNVECLRRNAAHEIAAGKVVVCPKGVWNKDDVLPLNVEPNNTASYSVALRPRGSHPGPQVQLTTIDELVRDLKLERVDYIKMNIEGAEREALAGGASTIRRFHPRLTVAMQHRYDDPQAIPRLVRSIWSGYETAPGRCVEINAGLRPLVITFHPPE